jgi:hypothetical protein
MCIGKCKENEVYRIQVGMLAVGDIGLTRERAHMVMCPIQYRLDLEWSEMMLGICPKNVGGFLT